MFFAHIEYQNPSLDINTSEKTMIVDRKHSKQHRIISYVTIIANTQYILIRQSQISFLNTPIYFVSWTQLFAVKSIKSC